jgi:hypothetical protein
VQNPSHPTHPCSGARAGESLGSGLKRGSVSLCVCVCVCVCVLGILLLEGGEGRVWEEGKEKGRRRL